MKTGDRAPDWILSDSRGEAISFYQHSAERPAVLLFWATWCPQCTELMPKLEALRAQLDSRIPVYALNIWEDADPVAHMRDKGLDFTLLLDADRVAKRYNVRAAPGLFVVNSDKSIQYIRAKDSSADQVIEAVREVLTKGAAE